MKTTSARTRTAAIGVLLAAATFGLPTAQAAMSRLPAGGNYAWQVNRSRNINLKTPRGNQTFANWFTVNPVLQPTTVLQPAITYANPHTGTLATVGSLATYQTTAYTVGLQTSLLSSYINSGAVLTLSKGATDLQGSSATIYPGSLAGTASVVNTVNLSGSSRTLMVGGVNYYSGSTGSAGSLTLTSGSFATINGYYLGSSGSAGFVSVPEPTSIGLLLCTGGLLLHRRRR